MLESSVFAQEQIRRLGGLNGFPLGNQEATTELALALMAAPNEHIARRAIDSLLFGTDECPKPADIRRAVLTQAERAESMDPSPPKPKCPTCGGLGFILERFVLTEDKIDERHWVTHKTKLHFAEDTNLIRETMDSNQQIIETTRMCSCHPAFEEAKSWR